MKTTVQFLGLFEKNSEGKMSVVSIRHRQRHVITGTVSRDLASGTFVTGTLEIDPEAEKKSVTVEVYTTQLTGCACIGPNGNFYVALANGAWIPYNPKQHRQFLEGIILQPAKVSMRTPATPPPDEDESETPEQPADAGPHITLEAEDIESLNAQQ